MWCLAGWLRGGGRLHGLAGGRLAVGLARLGHGLVARGALAAEETPLPASHITVSHVSRAPQNAASESRRDVW